MKYFFTKNNKTNPNHPQNQTPTPPHPPKKKPPKERKNIEGLGDLAGWREFGGKFI